MSSPEPMAVVMLLLGLSIGGDNRTISIIPPGVALPVPRFPEVLEDVPTPGVEGVEVTTKKPKMIIEENNRRSGQADHLPTILQGLFDKLELAKERLNHECDEIKNIGENDKPLAWCLTYGPHEWCI